MKITFCSLFLFLSLSLFGQRPQNEVPTTADSKTTLEAQQKNKQIRRRAAARRRDDAAGRLRTSNRIIAPNSLAYKYDGVKKERPLFKEADTHHVAVMDLEAYFLNNKKQPVKIFAGEQVQILKKKKNKFKIKHKHRKLYIDRQFYVAPLEKE